MLEKRIPPAQHSSQPSGIGIVAFFRLCYKFNCDKYFLGLNLNQVLWSFRKNLSELDDIRKYFSCKLSTPVFFVLGEQNQNSVGREVHRDSEMDTKELLLKSNQLVGEVNDVIKSKPVRSSPPMLLSKIIHYCML